MFVIRNTFVAKPGSASKLAAQLKEAVAAFQMPGARVMTDITGDFNRVIMDMVFMATGIRDYLYHRLKTSLPEGGTIHAGWMRNLLTQAEGTRFPPQYGDWRFTRLLRYRRCRSGRPRFRVPHALMTFEWGNKHGAGLRRRRRARGQRQRT
jgi:hypothetical protein